VGVARTAREAVAPLYLLLCLLLGGSAQGVWTNLILQLLGVAIIGWAAAARATEPLGRAARQLFWIVLAGLVVVLIQLIPLPATLWPRLGGREQLAAGYDLLGLAVPPLPVSLAPDDSISTLLTLIPALAMLCAILALKAYRPVWLALALLAGVILGIVLGALQVASPDPFTSLWYLYPRSSVGMATGFFANSNHMAIALVVTLPFLAAMLASARRADPQRYSASLVPVAVTALVVVVGIALNQSLAGYGLAVPVIAASSLLIIRRQSPAVRWIVGTTAVLLVAAIIALVLSPIGDRSLGTSRSVESRETMTATTLRAAGDFLPLGSGLGTFRGIYRLYEDHDRVTSTYVNHAHDDYAELALETGIPGMIVLALFLWWWGAAAWRAWRFGDAGPYARAASLASAAILIHSAVDFPLRTAAISVVFAMSLALLVERRARAHSQQSELRPTRHVELA
jgi:O-antigen ligase